MNDADAFALAVKLVLDDEGRMSDDPVDDPDGGLTKFGIAQKQHPSVDVKNLTRDGAVAIYRSEYWAASGADRSPWPVSFMLFDCAVNQGVVTAIRLLQRAIGSGSGIDGDFGPGTEMAVQKADPWELTARFTALRLQRYVATKEYDRDGQGWFYRVGKNLMAAGRSAPV